MKKIVFLLSMCVVTLGSLTSCRNDDEKKENVSSSNQLVGKWANYSTIENGVEKPYKNEECGMDYILFSSDNTFKEIDVFNCKEKEFNKGTYTIKGNKISMLNTDGSVYEAEISINTPYFSFIENVDGKRIEYKYIKYNTN